MLVWITAIEILDIGLLVLLPLAWFCDIVWLTMVQPLARSMPSCLSRSTDFQQTVCIQVPQHKVW